MDRLDGEDMRAGIFIKSHIHGWVEVTEEQARAWVRTMLDGIHSAHKRARVQDRIRGITIDELMEVRM